MRFLFVHQNFPGQFKTLAPAVAADPVNEVVAFTMRKDAPTTWQNIRMIPYQANRGTSRTVHPWVADFETKTIRGEAAFRAARDLKTSGFSPDIIIAHPGWGESLFLKDVWPEARLAIYCEFHYHTEGADTGFDPEFPLSEDGAACRLRLKNLNNLVHFEIADAGLSPTHWQASTFPERFRRRIAVIHDGIDTRLVTPDPAVIMTLDGGAKLTREDCVITFVNRNLEPYRGYHVFMRALPAVMQRLPDAQILIVGGDGVSYGAPPPAGKTWKDIFHDEVKDRIDPARLHFLGRVPYGRFVNLLQLSTVHVYLTYPFVLSWSLLEAMSAGCAIVASDTKPLHEAIAHDQTGVLRDFFDVEGLADGIVRLASAPDERRRLGEAARRFAQAHYDLDSVCLPRQLAWVRSIVAEA